jgi:hypothetical protein
MSDDCEHPFKNRYTTVRWEGEGRVRVEKCDACGHVNEIVECNAGVHSLFDFCPGAAVCQGG